VKGILVLLDGLGDLPHKLLNNKTPLEDAKIPNMDFFVARGEMGYMYSVKPGFVPESDEAVVSIFGNELFSSTRGQIEAKGAGLKLVRGDLAFRVNFATIDSLEKGNIIDRRAGRTLTTEEAEILSMALNKIKLPVKFLFEPTIQHRAVLIFKGGFSDDITGNDTTYLQGKAGNADKITRINPLNDDENSIYTANIVNEFLNKSYEILKNHPVNINREKKGLMPANFLLIRGPGIEIPQLKLYRKWLAVAYTPLEKGIASLSGMDVFSFDYPKLEGLDSYENLYEGLVKACKFSIQTIKNNYKKYDYAYIHIKETDLPGHDNKPLEKKEMIEYIDQTLFNFLRKFAPQNKIKIIVTGDHSTPCKLKKHSADPLPVLFYNDSIPREKHFSEASARIGSLGRIEGKDLLKKVGFVR